MSDNMPNGYLFEIDGGEKTAKGKPVWPDCLNVVMDKANALDIVMSILGQLRGEREQVSIGFCGQLTEDD